MSFVQASSSGLVQFIIRNSKESLYRVTKDDSSEDNFNALFCLFSYI